MTQHLAESVYIIIIIVEKDERERTHQTVDSADLPSMDHSSESTSNRAASIIHIIQGVLTINISIVHIIQGVLKINISIIHIKQGVLIINISTIHLIQGVLTIDASIIIQICSQEYWGNHNNYVNNCFVKQYFDQI